MMTSTGSHDNVWMLIIGWVIVNWSSSWDTCRNPSLPAIGGHSFCEVTFLGWKPLRLWVSPPPHRLFLIFRSLNSANPSVLVAQIHQHFFEGKSDEILHFGHRTPLLGPQVLVDHPSATELLRVCNASAAQLCFFTLTLRHTQQLDDVKVAQELLLEPELDDSLVGA